MRINQQHLQLKNDHPETKEGERKEHPSNKNGLPPQLKKFLVNLVHLSMQRRIPLSSPPCRRGKSWFQFL